MQISRWIRNAKYRRHWRRNLKKARLFARAQAKIGASRAPFNEMELGFDKAATPDGVVAYINGDELLCLNGEGEVVAAFASMPTGIQTHIVKVDPVAVQTKWASMPTQFQPWRVKSAVTGEYLQFR